MKFRMSVAILAAAGFGALFAPNHARAVSPEWAERWRADLAWAADTLPLVHARIDHTLPRARLRAEIDSLRARVGDLEHHEIAVELARIMASIGDGHTRLTLPFDSAATFFTGHSRTPPPHVPGLVFRHLPVRLHAFADGLYVIRAAPEHRALLGGRVIAIGGHPIAEVTAAIGPTVHADNERHAAQLLPEYLVVPEILHARGVLDDRERVRIDVEREGERRGATLRPAAVGVAPEWIEARPADAMPLRDRHAARRHWIEALPGAPLTYVRIREVYDDPGQTLAALAESIAAIAGGGRGLVIDVRQNPGGNNFLNRALVREIVAAEPLRDPARLFVLTDGGTFSAAMMLVSSLERWTPAIRVGQKTGGRPNGYGDSRRVRLPRTGLTLRVSTLYWQLGDPTDRRDGIQPHVEVAETFADWVRGRDAALDTVLALTRAAGDPSGEWKGEIVIGEERFPAHVHLDRAGGAWRGTLTLPSLDVKDAGLTDVALAPDELRFAWDGGGVPWRFRALPAANAWTGVALFQGALVPFFLARDDVR